MIGAGLTGCEHSRVRMPGLSPTTTEQSTHTEMPSCTARCSKRTTAAGECMHEATCMKQHVACSKRAPADRNAINAPATCSKRANDHQQTEMQWPSMHRQQAAKCLNHACNTQRQIMTTTGGLTSALMAARWQVSLMRGACVLALSQMKHMLSFPPEAS